MLALLLRSRLSPVPPFRLPVLRRPSRSDRSTRLPAPPRRARRAHTTTRQGRPPQRREGPARAAAGRRRTGSARAATLLHHLSSTGAGGPGSPPALGRRTAQPEAVLPVDRRASCGRPRTLPHTRRTPAARHSPLLTFLSKRAPKKSRWWRRRRSARALRGKYSGGRPSVSLAVSHGHPRNSLDIFFVEPMVAVL